MFHIAKAFSSISLPLTRTCAWFISSDQRKNRLLWSESYDFTPTRKPAMNFNHRHRKKVHYSRNISQPILMDPFFKVKRRIFFPRCRFLKLFKIHSNFSRLCTVFASCPYLQLAKPFLHVKDEKTSFSLSCYCDFSSAIEFA